MQPVDVRFKIAVDAVKILADPPGAEPVPENSTKKIDCSKHAFQLRWFVSDLLKGASPFVYKTNKDEDEGEEIRFNFLTEFQLESEGGVVAHLLQLSVIACSPEDAEAIERGEQPKQQQQQASSNSNSSNNNNSNSGGVKILGVLMIDLNAHVPRPPAQVSSQKATLYLSRSPLTPPPLMRIAIQGKPAPNEAEIQLQEQRRLELEMQQQRQFTSHPRSARGGGVDAFSSPQVDSIERRSSPSPRNNTSNSSSVPPPPPTPVSPIALTPASNKIVEELLELTSPSDTKHLAEAFETAKKQLRSLVSQNETQRREIIALQRRNRIQAEEMTRLREQRSEVGVQRVRAAYEAKISNLRAEINDLRMSNADLRSLSQSAEILAESLTRELEAARREAREGANIARDSHTHLDEALAKNARYESALKHGQEEIIKLHAYCAQAKSAFEDALASLQKERLENAHNKRRCEDLQRLLDASRLVRQKENQQILPLRS